MRFSIISISQTTFLSNYIQKSSYLLFLRYLYYFLYKYIQLVYKEVSYYYYIVIAFYISFFKSSQDPQILLLFQFIQLFSPRRTYSRSISNLSYRFSFPKSQFSIFQNLLQILLQSNLTSKFLYLCFFLFKLYSYLSLFRRLGYSYLILRVLNLTYLILRILYYRKLLSLTYLYIFKLSYYFLLLVIVYYRSLSYSRLILRILGISYLILRILSLQPFAFIKQ